MQTLISDLQEPFVALLSLHPQRLFSFWIVRTHPEENFVRQAKQHAALSVSAIELGQPVGVLARDLGVPKFGARDSDLSFHPIDVFVLGLDQICGDCPHVEVDWHRVEHVVLAVIPEGRYDAERFFRHASFAKLQLAFLNENDF